MLKVITSLSLSPELLEKIDVIRKLVPRSAYVESILKDFFERLEGDKKDGENKDSSD